MAKRGRPAIPARVKKLEGNPGKRKAAPAKEPKVTGLPRRPTGLSKEARLFWDEVVALLAKSRVVKEVDTHSLTLLAETWGLLREAHKILKDHPCDRDARIAYTAYLGQWGKIAERFGLDPS
jgi:phage terminase small subunit